ncbi:YeeE/YedE family protein [Rhizobium helianthi]|uniref:YeeE/YedE family protein n=1 Tax=Rhizobium helianthi TaxID=1132695 RepID=A0ABW4M0L6_9HYPH
MSMSSFLLPFAGGLLIGTSAGLYLLLNGRIAGISGLVASASYLGNASSRSLAWSFLGGILAGAFVLSLLLGWPEVVVTSSLPILIVSGLIVGFGTRLGSGCTSGHGVCGLARLSPRSLVATAIFMLTAMLTVFVVQHLLGGVV